MQSNASVLPGILSQHYEDYDALFVEVLLKFYGNLRCRICLVLRLNLLRLHFYYLHIFRSVIV